MTPLSPGVWRASWVMVGCARLKRPCGVGELEATQIQYHIKTVLQGV